jgi:hypothetical protein
MLKNNTNNLNLLCQKIIPIILTKTQLKQILIVIHNVMTKIHYYNMST